MKRTFLFAALLLLLHACREQEVEFRANNCKAVPAFVRNLSSFNPAHCSFSTSEIRKMGLVLIENAGADGKPKYYQHPSWQKGGWLAPIVLDEAGNIFTAPAPFINVLNNLPKNQNTVYRVDARSGVMDEFLRLPIPDSSSENNPYGIIGMAYLCEAGVLYVSTLMGSDRLVERGAIYAINIKTREIIDHIDGMDAMGMGISYATGHRELFFGTGRRPTIFSVTLDARGDFKSKPVDAFSLAGLGPRGDDKVRRIIADERGNLQVHAIEFDYNLIAPREKQEALYYFQYNAGAKQWIYQPESQ